MAFNMNNYLLQKYTYEGEDFEWRAPNNIPNDTWPHIKVHRGPHKTRSYFDPSISEATLRDMILQTSREPRKVKLL